MKNICVTGANGYIGRHVITRLQASRRWNITACDLADKGLFAGVRFCARDILTQPQDAQLYQELGRPDVCLHLAWQDGFMHNAPSHIDKLPAHFHFLQNLVEHGCMQLLVAGSFREYGPCNGRVSEEHPAVADNYYSWAKISLKRLLELYLQDKPVTLQWLRFFTPYGNDEYNNSVLSKIIRWESEGKTSFPFTEGKEQYDYIHINDLARQIAAAAAQTEISGAINCCSGTPSSLKEKVEELIAARGFKIRPQYGAFKTREYDSPVIYGDNAKIQKILEKYEKAS